MSDELGSMIVELQVEIARLAAEVERMRAVVDAARGLLGRHEVPINLQPLEDALRALDGDPYSIVIGPLDDGPVGVTREIGYLDGKPCPTCHGTKTDTAGDPQRWGPCPTCGGTGRKP